MKFNTVFYQKFFPIISLRNKLLTFMVNQPKFNYKKFYSTSGKKYSNNKRLDSNYVEADNYILYKEVKNILMNNPLNNETQRKIEEFLLSNKLSKSSTDSFELHIIIGRLNKELKEELLRCSDELYSLIKNFKDRNFMDIYKSKKKKLTKKEMPRYYLSLILKEVSIDFIVSLLLGKSLRIMNSTTQDEVITSKIFIELGEHLLSQYYYVLYSKEKEDKIKSLNSSNIKYNMLDWRIENEDLLTKTNDSIISHGIGALLIDWLRDVELLEMSIENSLSENKTKISVIGPTLKIKNIFYLKKAFVLPNKIPMIIKPKEYKREVINNKKREELGGYLLNGEYYSNEIIIPNWRSRELSRIEDKNIIYKTINNMSSVGYKINKNVLDFIRLNDKRLGLTMLNLTHPLEIKSKENSKLYKWEKIELERFLSKRSVQENIIGLADVYENIPIFYIPVRMDYRGRIYCEVDYLNYQGTDLAKSLLLFSKGEKILKSNDSAIEYLKILGANCFGNSLDKKSFIDRIKWVDENLYNIRNFENGELISKAESKFMFISFCFEFNRWLDCLNDSNSTHFITYLPVQLDASCNGYQHISMLVQDIDLGKHLNLTKSKRDDIPNDFYSFISSYLDEYYNYVLNEGVFKETSKENILRLKDLNITRSILKRAIMTIPYNASSIQLIKYLQENFIIDEYETKLRNANINTYDDNDLFSVDIEGTDMDNDYNKDKPNKIKRQIWYKHREDSSIKLEQNDFIVLYKGLVYILERVFPSLNLISKYFKDIAFICSKLGINIPWYVPTGLIVQQSYMQIKETRVQPLNFSRNTFALKIPVREKYDKDKQMRALMPNLIHSLDSASLSLLINKYFYEYHNEVKNIYAIHDCFAVTCNNMEYIINTLKLVYIYLYSDKGYLKKLNEDLILHIKNHISDAFSMEDMTIDLPNSKPIKFPDINKVLRHTLDVKTIKHSAYIIL